MLRRVAAVPSRYPQHYLAHLPPFFQVAVGGGRLSKGKADGLTRSQARVRRLAPRVRHVALAR